MKNYIMIILNSMKDSKNKLLIISLIFYSIAIIISVVVEMQILTIIFSVGVLYDIVSYIRLKRNEKS